MKGDLHTLKKVCKYAATVMLIGKYVLAALIVILLILGIGSFFNGDMANILNTWVGVNKDASDLVKVASFLEEELILIMGFITVWETHKIMDSVKTEYTPFIIDNADRIKAVSFTFLFSSVLLFALSLLADKGIKLALFMFFGSLLVAVVLYCLTIVVRYGVLLQKESDETL